MEPSISVIIPTLNRGPAIFETLKSVLEQSGLAMPYEVLLVDSSTDDTISLVRSQFQVEISSEKLRLFDERRVGSHYAKNLGIIKSKGPILAFLEDDAIANETWLSEILKSFEDPAIGCVGGRVDPIWEAEPPASTLLHKEMFTLFDLGDESKELNHACLVGCNIALRKSVLIEIGGYNPDIIGSQLLGDGETGLQRKLLSHTKFKILYNPQIKVRHHVPKKRMNSDYLSRRFWNEGACHAYTYFQINHPGSFRLVLLAFSGLIRSYMQLAIAYMIMLFNKDKGMHRKYIAAYFRRKSEYFLKLLMSEKFRKFATIEDWIHQDEISLK